MTWAQFAAIPETYLTGTLLRSPPCHAHSRIRCTQRGTHTLLIRGGHHQRWPRRCLPRQIRLVQLSSRHFDHTLTVQDRRRP